MTHICIYIYKYGKVIGKHKRRVELQAAALDWSVLQNAYQTPQNAKVRLRLRLMLRLRAKTKLGLGHIPTHICVFYVQR